jgi:hypothetical protein
VTVDYVSQGNNDMIVGRIDLRRIVGISLDLLHVTNYFYQRSCAVRILRTPACNMKHPPHADGTASRTGNDSTVLDMVYQLQSRVYELEKQS